MRARGEGEDADALLLVPLLVRGRAVNWIDSKAMYGEAETHGEYYASQYTAYLNRFDAGMSDLLVRRRRRRHRPACCSPTASRPSAS